MRCFKQHLHTKKQGKISTEQSIISYISRHVWDLYALHYGLQVGIYDSILLEQSHKPRTKEHEFFHKPQWALDILFMPRKTILKLVKA